MVNKAVRGNGWITNILRGIGTKLGLREHPNSIGYHFYLPVNPLHVVGVELCVTRLNIYFPLWVSFSFGVKGKVGLQIAGGVKYDPTASAQCGENDYLLGLNVRINLIGEYAGVNAEASL